MHLDGVEAVGVWSGASPTRDNFGVDEEVVTESGEVDIGDRAVTAGRDAVGQCLGECAEHGVNDALAGVGTCRDRRGRARIEDRAFRRKDRDSVEEAAVGRDTRVECCLQGVVDGRLERRPNDVHRDGRLPTSAGEVEGDLAIRDCDGHSNGDALVTRAIGIEPVGVRVGTIRHRRDGEVQTTLGVVQELL